jgi:hypothetical protein
VLLLAEPDMGAFMVIAMIAMGILFLGGVNGRMFALGVAVLVGTFVLMIVFSDLRARAHLCLPRPLEPEVRAGQGLPADALADRLRPRRAGSARAWAAASRSCTTCPRRTPTSCWR